MTIFVKRIVTNYMGLVEFRFRKPPTQEDVDKAWTQWLGDSTYKPHLEIKSKIDEAKVQEVEVIEN